MTVKPLVDNIIPIDIKNETTITFQYSGNLPYSNKLTIYQASDQTLVWEDTVAGLSFSHIIPANLNTRVDVGTKWRNGNKYALTITVYDALGNATVSDKKYFYTYSTPQFELNLGQIDPSTGKDIIYSEPVIKDTGISPILVYNQLEGERLAEYQFFIYENTVSEYTASQAYACSEKPPFRYTYEYKGLKNTVYYLRAKGMTEKGIPMDTGMYKLTIKHVSPDGFSVLQLRSDDNATVEGITNAITIDPNERLEDGFIVIDSEVQLLDKSLTYEHNYKVQRDFTLSLKMSRCKFYSKTPKQILKMRNGAHEITLTSYIYDDDSLRYHLIVDNGLCTNNHYTAPLFVENEETVVVHIRRINNLYHVEALVCY